MCHRARMFGVLVAGSLWLAAPAGAEYVTLWEHSTGAPTTPWTVVNGAPSDLMSAYPLGRPILDFPVFSGPVFQKGLAMTGMDPDQTGFAVRIGGVASAPNVGHSPPLCLTTSFTHPLFPDTNFTINMKFELPLFDDAVIWHEAVRITYDPSAPAGEDNFWYESGRLVKYVSTQPGRFGGWERRAQAWLNGERIGPGSLHRIQDYITEGQLVKVELPQLSHGRLAPEPPPPGNPPNEVEINIELVDVPSPGVGMLGAMGALAWLRRRR